MSTSRTAEVRPIRELRAVGRAALQAAHPERPLEVHILESDMLLGAVLGYTKEQLLMRREDPVGSEQQAAFRAFLERRLKDEPVAYILGRREFYSRDFIVTPSVLIPRPETELLVERAVALLAGDEEPCVVIDVGVGSGAIILTIVAELLRLNPGLVEQSLFIGTDISLAALAVARENARLLRLSERVHFVAADLCTMCAPMIAHERRLLVLSNPPYIPDEDELPPDVGRYEPSTALFSGPAGLDAISRLLAQTGVLFAGVGQGELLIEIGYGQEHAVESLARAEGYRNVSFLKDIQGITRVVELR